MCSKCFDLGRALIPCITGSSKKPLFDPTTFRSKTRGSSAGAGRPRGAMASEGEEVEGPYDDDFEEEELSEDETWARGRSLFSCRSPGTLEKWQPWNFWRPKWHMERASVSLPKRHVRSKRGRWRFILGASSYMQHARVEKSRLS